MTISPISAAVSVAVPAAVAGTVSSAVPNPVSTATSVTTTVSIVAVLLGDQSTQRSEYNERNEEGPDAHRDEGYVKNETKMVIHKHYVVV